MANSNILRAFSGGLLSAMLLISATALMPASASFGAPTSDSSDREIARCIAHTAGGSDWLAKTLWGLRDQEGGRLGIENANANGTYDLGPLQINSWWVPRIATMLDQPERNVRYWLKFDACFNADTARWLFLTALRSTGDYWRAVGVYHSPAAWRQRRYALGVADHLKRRFGPSVFSGTTDSAEGTVSGIVDKLPDVETKSAKQERLLGFGMAVDATPKAFDQ